MVSNKGRSERLALLSEKERQLLDDYERKDKLGAGERAKISRGLIELVKKLDIRLDALFPDLEYIVYNQALRPLIPRKLDGLQLSVELLTREMENMKATTVQNKSTYVQGYYSWKIYSVEKEGRKCYWLSTTEPPEITVMDYTKPEFAMRGIKGRWSNNNQIIDVRKILKKALELELQKPNSVKNIKHHEVIPHSEKDAISIGQIKDRIDKLEEIHP